MIFMYMYDDAIYFMLLCAMAYIVKLIYETLDHIPSSCTVVVVRACGKRSSI
jgi:hypothetical protein